MNKLSKNLLYLGLAFLLRLLSTILFPPSDTDSLQTSKIPLTWTKSLPKCLTFIKTKKIKFHYSKTTYLLTYLLLIYYLIIDKIFHFFTNNNPEKHLQNYLEILYSCHDNDRKLPHRKNRSLCLTHKVINTFKAEGDHTCEIYIMQLYILNH